MNLAEIKKKIQKLLALAKGSTSENESAQAFARAQSLMEKHEILEAELGETVLEDIEEQDVESGQRLASWKKALAHTLARHTGCYSWTHGTWEGKTIRVTGRKSDLDRFNLLFSECAIAINRLAKQHARGKGRSFGAGFRYGVVAILAKEAAEERRKLREELKDDVNASALVVLDSRHDDARSDAQSRYRLRSGRAPKVDGAGYYAGTKHGKGVYAQASRRKVGGSRPLRLNG